MNDFELRRRLRAWRIDEVPARDLWSRVASRVAADPGPAPRARPPLRRRAWPEAAAAGIALALGLGIARLEPPPSPLAQADARALIERSFAAAVAEAGAWIPPAEDGTVRQAQATIDGAQTELVAALAAEPDSQALLTLLQRTHEQRLRLLRLAARAG